MNAIQLPHPLNGAFHEAQPLERELIGILYEARPHPIVVRKVMKALAVKPNAEKVHGKEREFQTYLAFCILRARVTRILSRYGFELKRSGGTINDEIWIEPHAGSPSN